jgi:hypothetical protein
MATYNDTIMSELIASGYTTGTINDRERKRLLAKTGNSGVGKTLGDLYFLAGESNRLAGEKSPSQGGGGGTTLVINDDGLGVLSTTDAVVTDDLAGNLATTSTDVTDSGTGILSSA